MSWVDNLLKKIFKGETFSFTFKGSPRIDAHNEAIYIKNGKQEGKGKYDKVRWGNIVYYEDIPNCGYPICINKGFWTQVMVDNFSFDVEVASTVDLMQGRGPTTKHKPMFYRCDQFFQDNHHLGVTDKDVPEECKWLHEFQNWYEDTYGEQPKIMRGNHFMNEPYFKHNQ